jgi:hypothetical protein
MGHYSQITFHKGHWIEEEFVQIDRIHSQPAGTTVVVKRFPYFEVQMVVISMVLFSFFSGIQAGYFGILINLCTNGHIYFL